jgi:hypothetical protein
MQYNNIKEYSKKKKILKKRRKISQNKKHWGKKL